MPLNEQQKKNLMILGVVGVGGAGLFLLMRGRSGSNPPVQANTPVFSSGYPGGSTNYVPTPAPPIPFPGPNPSPTGCHPPLLGCPPGTTWNQDICGCYGGGPTTCVPPTGGCPPGQAWSQAECRCMASPGPIPTPFPCMGDSVGGGCPVGYHCVGGFCVPDIGNLFGQGKGGQTPVIAPMLMPTAQPVPGAKGGQAPQGEINNNIYGDHADGRPSGYADNGEFLYNWNLLSAYYAMRLS